MKGVTATKVLIIVALLTSALITSVGAESTEPAGRPAVGLVDQLRDTTGGQVRISHHAYTGKVRFIGTDLEHTIAPAQALQADATPEEAARQFLEAYGSLFGLLDPAQELEVMRVKVRDRGRSFVRFQQVYRGVPVVGGELIVQMDADKNVVSANGEVLPDLNLDVTPAVSAAVARQTALDTVAKDYELSVDELRASEPELWIYNPIILGGPGPRFSTLVWRTEVTPVELAPIRELVLVDAQFGAVALHFNQVDTARNRMTYDANNGTTLPGTLRCDESNPTCSGGDTHEVAAHTFAGASYDFYNSEHGRDSIDDAGMTLISTVHYDSGYANAFWNGEQMVYGDAYGFPLADDVVAHELTHGVTSYESQLFYFYQSGAVNEAFSDIWGEFVDLYGATDNDVGDTRWEMGEDISGLGALRNMQDPTLFGLPDRMGSSYYYCAQSSLYDGSGDNGGVHYNMGVGSKAAYLLTDGDTFNGYTVTGLGYAKVADLFYEVQTNLFTSAADYADLYDALIQACTNLGYSSADCQEVQDAVDATEMDQQPSACPAPEAPICTAGNPSNLFFDNIESGSGNWTSGSNSGTIYWYVPQTTSSIGLAEPYATSGVGNIWGFDQGSPFGGTSDTYLAMNSDVTLPANAYLHFNHSYGFESNSSGTTFYDGGVVEYSTNGGSTWNDAGSLFNYNGYNATLSSSNPLGAVSAFGADSRGYISSRLNLSLLAGQNVRFRFRIGTDSSVYDYGWFIDDVRIYTCSTATYNWFLYLPFVFMDYPPGPPDPPTLNVISNDDGDGNYSVSWSAPSGATSYTLQEADNSAFSGATTVYSGSGTSTSITGQPVGRYYYRVRASNEYGTSAWSDVRSVSVSPPTRLYAVSDATILEGAPSSNFGGTIDMWVGYDHCYGAQRSRSLVRFDLSDIPAGTSISNATLSLYLYGSCDTGNRNHTVKVHRNTESWSSSSVTWNNRPDYTGTYASRSIPSRTWARYTFNVTDLVRGWVNGDYSNYGMTLRGPESSGNDSACLWFNTINQSGTTYDPYLNITYDTVTGLEQTVVVGSSQPAADETAGTLSISAVLADLLSGLVGDDGELQWIPSSSDQ